MNSAVEIKPSFRILQLEDSEVDNDLTRIYLKALSFPYSLRQTPTSASFHEALSESSPNVIVSDSSIFGSDTGIVLAFVRQNHSGIPFIFYSGNLSPRIHEVAIEAGAAAFIDKGNPSLLISTLEGIQRKESQSLPPLGNSVIVQCKGFRCMAYRSKMGAWVDSFRHLPLPEVLTWEALGK